MDELRIPADMNQPEAAAGIGAKAVVSIRDMMVLLGATDQQLLDLDEQDEILEREPWRKDGLWFEAFGKTDGGMEYGVMRGEVDWSGTRFDKKANP